MKVPNGTRKEKKKINTVIPENLDEDLLQSQSYPHKIFNPFEHEDSSVLGSDPLGEFSSEDVI